MHFKDKVVWITGASSGIGAKLAEKLAKEGATLILTGRNTDALERVKNVCLNYTQHCQILAADLVAADLEQLVVNAISIFGHVDMLVNNAGVSQRSLAIETQPAVYRQLMEINFFVPMMLTRYILPHFTARGSGHIVAISSMAGLIGVPLRTGYAATKHAVKGFFEALQTELKTPNVYITMVSPGRINTPISLAALTAGGTPHSVMDKGQIKGITADKCADKIVNAIVKRKRHILIVKEERILWWIWWFVPALFYKIASKLGQQQ